MMEVNAPEKLCLKNIYELLDEKFYIPAYQRGYRWSTIQVKELLDDIWEFSQANRKEESTFYCLQPVVVVNGDTGWQVVDGQQRLTTLYLILHYLEQEHLLRPLTKAYKKSLFTIFYETRPDSAKFLQTIHIKSDTSLIDYFYMSKAYEAVKAWFSEKDYNDNNEFLATLLAKLPEDRAVKVIWYDLSDECIGNEYAIDVFSRINIGKIPLTNAELVKALFLQRSQLNESQTRLKQLQIATEWDGIEKQLQQDSFWHFINHASADQEYPTRIEYIFDLMKGKKADDEAFFTFHKFNVAFKTRDTNIDQLWKEVKDYFLTFDEWFQDRELYHLIGYLVDCGESVVSLKTESEREGTTKINFKNFLKRKIRRHVNCQLDALSYGDSQIKKVLLLFNIETLHGSREADVRFPFDRYKKESWDIEHLRSQTDIVPSGANRIDWLEDIQNYFNSKKFTKKPKFLKTIGELLKKQKIDNDEFTKVYFRVLKHFNENDAPWIDDLGNLALLDSSTNRSYKNALFPIKRARIIENDRQGVFVPICTKNVFLKYYSNDQNNLMYWEESDANDYLSSIGQILKDYLPNQGDTHDE